LSPRRRLGAAFAILRLESETIDEGDVTVKEIVSTEEQAIAEVDRLNELRRDPSYRYVWQATRWVDVSASDRAP
jgi:hypothetical protein